MRHERDAILTEMGLGPVWKLRSRPLAGEPVTAVAPKDALAAAEVDAGAAPIRPVEHGPITEVSATTPVNDMADSGREALISRMDWRTLKEAVSDCRACGLHAGRQRTVFGIGDEQAQWMLVGEAPGAEEDRLGEPFVGQAGRLLDSMLAAIGLKRGENVYIANVLKCRPPGNRNPEPQEVARCAPHLVRQVELVRPRVMLGLGRFAAHTLLDSEAPLASLRGKVHRYGGVPLVITYHPAYLLRNLQDKAKAWEDLLLARRALRETEGSPPDPA